MPGPHHPDPGRRPARRRARDHWRAPGSPSARARCWRTASRARVHRECAAEAVGRLAELPHREVAEPWPERAPKCCGFNRTTLFAVGDGCRVVRRQEARRGALVPALGERGGSVDDAAERRDRPEPVLPSPSREVPPRRAHRPPGRRIGSRRARAWLRPARPARDRRRAAAPPTAGVTLRIGFLGEGPEDGAPLVRGPAPEPVPRLFGGHGSLARPLDQDTAVSARAAGWTLSRSGSSATCLSSSPISRRPSPERAQPDACRPPRPPLSATRAHGSTCLGGIDRVSDESITSLTRGLSGAECGRRSSAPRPGRGS